MSDSERVKAWREAQQTLKSNYESGGLVALSILKESIAWDWLTDAEREQLRDERKQPRCGAGDE